jgi:hypothetical protein
MQICGGRRGLTAAELRREVARRAAGRSGSRDARREAHIDQRGTALLGAITRRTGSRDEHVRELDVAVSDAEAV